MAKAIPLFWALRKWIGKAGKNRQKFQTPSVAIPNEYGKQGPCKGGIFPCASRKKEHKDVQQHDDLPRDEMALVCAQQRLMVPYRPAGRKNLKNDAVFYIVQHSLSPVILDDIL